MQRKALPCLLRPWCQPQATIARYHPGTGYISFLRGRQTRTISGRTIRVEASSAANNNEIDHTADRYVVLFNSPSSFNRNVIVTQSIETDGHPWRNLSFGGTPADSLLQGRVRMSPSSHIDGDFMRYDYVFSGRCGYIDTMASAGVSFLKALSTSEAHVNHLHSSAHRVLSIGLGVGSLPNWITRSFPQMKVDVVEIDPIVVHAAVNFFGLPASKLTIYKKDILDYLDQDAVQSGGHSLMFLDIFNEDGLPRDIFNVEFVKKLRKQLRPNGVLVANIFCNIKLFNQILQMFESSFKTVHLLAVEENRNNIIMVAYNANAVPAEKLLETGSNIAEHHRLDFDLEHVLRFALSEGSYGHAQED